MVAAVDCPACGRAFVVKCCGRCRCRFGAYLIDHWQGEATSQPLVLPAAPVWRREQGHWRRLRPRANQLRVVARSTRSLPPDPHRPIPAPGWGWRRRCRLRPHGMRIRPVRCPGMR
jgi:hypothetical protein